MVLQRPSKHYGLAVIVELKRLHSPDVQDLRNWEPESQDFAIQLQTVVGPKGSPGEESFDVTLCTPGWVELQTQSQGIVSGHHLLIVAYYSYDLIYQYISKYLATCTGNTWQEVATKISRLGYWEFEDYNP